MKIMVSFKNPDALHYAVEQATAGIWHLPDLSDEEKKSLVDERKHELMEKLSKWFKYGEYVHLEIDTDADTCTVLRQKA